MNRRDFIKKSAVAAAATAVVVPVSAMLTKAETTGLTAEEAEPVPMNMMFEMMNMPVVTSQYWNIAYGAGKGEVKLDTEGMQTMRTLATNMAWLLEKIHTNGNTAPKRDERHVFMNFIR